MRKACRLKEVGQHLGWDERVVGRSWGRGALLREAVAFLCAHWHSTPTVAGQEERQAVQYSSTMLLPSQLEYF